MNRIFKVEVYNQDQKQEWDAFVRHSSNATFLFHRDFMEYHQDRFDDYSLMIYKNDSLFGIFPANKYQNELYSHQGLTYGGLLFKHNTETKEKYSAFLHLMDVLKSENLKSLIIKPLPAFYYSENSVVFNYSSIDNSSSVIKSNRVMAIDYSSDFNIHKTKIKRFKKLETNGFQVRQSTSEFDPFWNDILVRRLDEKHNSKPVHSLSEIKSLNEHFENNILQYNIYDQEEILAGITIFKKGHVVKSQYGMALSKGEKTYALDMLFVYLIQKYRQEGMHYFSMGTVNDNSDLGYSKGMMKQKEEFGCQLYLQNVLKIQIND